MKANKKYDMKPIINLMDESINKLKRILNNKVKS